MARSGCPSPVRNSVAACVMAWTLVVALPSPVVASVQATGDRFDQWIEENAHLPLFGPDSMQLSPERLVPSRLIKQPTGAYLDSIFRSGVQVIVSLERTIATRWIEDTPTLDYEGFRVRWRANTHNQIDEAWIDFETLGLRRTVAGYRSLTWYENGQVIDVSIPADSAPSRTVQDAPHRPFYSNVTLPYVFAAMNVADGSRFRLEGYSTERGRSFPIRVDVIGRTTFEDTSGQLHDVLEVESRSPSSFITWYVDPLRAPHYWGSIWRTLAPDGSVATVAEERIVDWVAYDRDAFGDRTRGR